MARSRVARTSPTLPPSAINASAKASAMFAIAAAFDGDADIGESRRYRRVRLVHGNAYGAQRRKTLQQCLGARASGGFNQPVAPRAERLARRLHDHVVRNSIVQLVGTRGGGKIDIENEIERESLPDFGFVLHHAVIRMQHEAVDKDGVAHRARLIAAATAKDCNVGATSCVRMMAAPCSTARRWAAIEPPSRSVGSDGVIE